jgi:hypothetical protein
MRSRKPARWRGSFIPSPNSLRTKARRLDRQIDDAERVVGFMRQGSRLLLHYANGKPVWLLSRGGEVMPATANLVITRNDITDVGGSLFPELGCPAQTYRFIEPTRRRTS